MNWIKLIFYLIGWLIVIASLGSAIWLMFQYPDKTQTRLILDHPWRFTGCVAGVVIGYIWLCIFQEAE